MPQINMKVEGLPELKLKADIDPEEFLDACTAQELLQIYFLVQESLYQNKMSDYLTQKIENDAKSSDEEFSAIGG